MRTDITDLIRAISLANPLWDAPRIIHGEIVKLGIDVAQSSVARYMAKCYCPPSPSWRSFLDSKADGIASIDRFVVPTIVFTLLYGLVILPHGHRQRLSVTVSEHPMAEWLARQLSEAFPWDTVPRHLVRDRDGSYGAPLKQRRHAVRIRDRPIAPRCPRRNSCAERVIGSIRRECVDYLVIFNAEHFRRVLAAYQVYYNRACMHLSLAKDTPHGRLVQGFSEVIRVPHLDGLHEVFVQI